MNIFYKNKQHTKNNENKYKIISIILFVLFLVTNIYFIFIKKDNIIFNNYSFINPTINLIKRENLIVNFQELRTSLQSKYENRDDYLVSIYFEYLPTGANISVNKDEKIWPASLIKIPVAMAAMKKVQDEKWKLNNELVILDEDKDDEYGVLYKEPVGTTLSIKRVIEESLINSDNTAHFILLRNLDNYELEDVYNHLGLDEIINTLKRSPDQKSEDNRMTAKNYTIFFRSLYNATFLSKEYSQIFLNILEHAPKDYLSKGLPNDIVFVHKTGIRVDEDVKADSGIVYAGERPYLLTVMIQKKKNKNVNGIEAEDIFKDISEEVYNYVTKIH